MVIDRLTPVCDQRFGAGNWHDFAMVTLPDLHGFFSSKARIVTLAGVKEWSERYWHDRTTRCAMAHVVYLPSALVAEASI